MKRIRSSNLLPPHEGEPLGMQLEPQWFQASDEYVIHHAPLESRIFRFLAGLPNHGRLIIDTRVSMLPPNAWGAIPGWHLDFCPRYKNGELNLGAAWRNRDAYRAWTMYDYGPKAAVNDTTGTEFLHMWGGTSDLREIHEEVVGEDTIRDSYGACSAYIDESTQAVTTRIHHNEIVQFGPLDWHRAMPNKSHMCWRWWVRAVEFAEGAEPKNERRTQTQVYIETEHGGW